MSGDQGCKKEKRTDESLIPFQEVITILKNKRPCEITCTVF